jgi:FlaG/FlaF family flagellin (archaellin)
MKQLLITIALACALASSVFAGDIPSVNAPSPAGKTDVTKRSDIPTDGRAGQIPTSGAPDQLSNDALSIALSVLSFLIR